MLAGKRGQITIYIIVGLVLLIIVAGALQMRKGIFTSNDDVKIQQKGLTDAELVKGYISSCHNKVVVDAAYHLASHSGYYGLPRNIGSIGDYQYAYSFHSVYADPDRTLSVAELTANYEQFVRDRIISCIFLFDESGRSDIKIEINDISPEVHIQNTTVDIDIAYDITAYINGETIFTMPDVSNLNVPLRLGALHEASRAIVGRIKEEPTLISAYHLDQIMQNLGNSANLTYYTEGDTNIYVIQDAVPIEYRARGPLTYIFGAKFS